MMVDLKQFCSTEEHRVRIQAPWSSGEYTYATDGHIGLRVPRRAAVTREDGPNLAEVFARAEARRRGEFQSIGIGEFPVYAQIACRSCAGTKMVECRCCGNESDCEDCDGTGLEWPSHPTAEIAPGRFFSTVLLQKMLSLPCVLVSLPEDPSEALLFNFDGGDGLLMPASRPAEVNVSWLAKVEG